MTLACTLPRDTRSPLATVVRYIIINLLPVPHSQSTTDNAYSNNNHEYRALRVTSRFTAVSRENSGLKIVQILHLRPQASALHNTSKRVTLCCQSCLMESGSLNAYRLHSDYVSILPHVFALSSANTTSFCASVKQLIAP